MTKTDAKDTSVRIDVNTDPEPETTDAKAHFAIRGRYHADVMDALQSLRSRYASFDAAAPIDPELTCKIEECLELLNKTLPKTLMATGGGDDGGTDWIKPDPE